MTVTKDKQRNLRAEIARARVELEEANARAIKANTLASHLFCVLTKLAAEAREEGIDVSIDDDAAND